MRHDARRKLSHRRLATRTAIAELQAPTAVGSGDLLGVMVLYAFICCYFFVGMVVVNTLLVEGVAELLTRLYKLIKKWLLPNPSPIRNADNNKPKNLN